MALKTVNTLIKLYKRRIDVLRREMLALEDQRRQLSELAQRLREEHAREMELAINEPGMAGFFGSYSTRVRERQEGIRQETLRLDQAIEEKAETIRGEFSEQKKYEIARENAKARMALEVRTRLQERFDEIGSQQYIRRKEHTA